MSNADILIHEIRNDIAIITSKRNAKEKHEIDIMEAAIAKLKKHITEFGKLTSSEISPHKNEVIGIMGMLENLTNKIELTKIESKKDILNIIQTIKAKNSYSNQKNNK